MESLVHVMLSNAVAATVLAVVVAALGRTYRRPALIHSLWLVVLLKLVTPPFVPVSVWVPIPMAMKVAAASEVPRSAEPAEDVGLAEPADAPLDIVESTVETRFVDTSVTWKWEHLVLALVLAGAIAWWTLAAVRIVRFQRLLHDVRAIPGDWQARTDELAERLGLGRRPSVCLVPGRVPPMLWAIGSRPRLLLPTELWSAMGADERTTLLLHELAHLKRRDHWVRWLELIVAGLYWWHPAAWWIRRELREAEEQCCDAWVVWAMPRGAKTYATALLAALEFVSGARTAPAAASATSGSGHVSCLKRRLRMIIRAKTPKGLSWTGRFAVLGLAALLLPLAPSWARSKSDDRKSSDALAMDHQLVARLTADDDDKDDEPKTDKEKDKDKDGDIAEGLKSELEDLITKLSKEIGPATEEIRRSLDRAVGEIHKSLGKEGLTAEDIAKALDRSRQELRKAFESGGPVDKEVREAIERSSKDAREAFERAQKDLGEVARDRAEALRDQARELADQARAKRDDLEAKKGEAENGEDQPNRQELESARREIRRLEQQLRSATNRLEALQRRESRRNPAARRPPAPPRPPADPRAEPAPRPEPAPRAEPVAPKPPAPPAAPAAPARPATPGARRGQSPDGTDPTSRRGQTGGAARKESDNARRLESLEAKMNQLLKELKDLKSEPKPKESDESSSRNPRPSRSVRSGLPTA